MRLGVFGGSFDPVHYGHLLLAEYCRTKCELDRVWFMPAATNPHKQHRATAPTEDRYQMLELAIAGHGPFAVSRLELDRGGVSFTVDTLNTIATENPDYKLFLLIGADTMEDLPNWKQPEEICRLATLVVVGRPGKEHPDFDCLRSIVDADRVAAFRKYQVSMPLMGLSATELRRRVAAGEGIRFQTPRAVEKYIETHGLYRDNVG